VHRVGEDSRKPTKNQGEIQGSRKPSVLVGFLRQKKELVCIPSRSHLHPLHRASENTLSQLGFVRTQDSCAAGEYSYAKRSSKRISLIAIRDLICAAATPSYFDIIKFNFL
jgi:hypothetical protein